MSIKWVGGGNDRRVEVGFEESFCLCFKDRRCDGWCFVLTAF